jgi:hypothetical protein
MPRFGDAKCPHFRVLFGYCRTHAGGMTFVGAGEEPLHTGRSPCVQPVCAHAGFHEIRSSYDQERCVLAFLLTCERCGATLRELRREAYRPIFDPRGNDPYLEPVR